MQIEKLMQTSEAAIKLEGCWKTPWLRERPTNFECHNAEREPEKGTGRPCQGAAPLSTAEVHTGKAVSMLWCGTTLASLPPLHVD